MAVNATEYQVQMHYIDQYGNDQNVCPKSTAMDVRVGRVPSATTLNLPGSDDNETLITSIQNIKKYLGNLSQLASEIRQVTSDTSDRSNINIPTTAVTSDIVDRIAGLDERFQAVTDLANTKAPMSHTATDLTHGGATAGLYGHVKLTDEFATETVNGDAAHSVAASQKAVYDAYNTLTSTKAPTNHAMSTDVYGLGTASKYGHVKTSNTYNATNADMSVVATQKALYDAWRSLSDSVIAQGGVVEGKAPISHLSSATTYGVGSETAYGHLKVNDNYNDASQETEGKAANGVSASSWAVKRAYSSLKDYADTKLGSAHEGAKATGSTFSHVKLHDDWTTNGGNASTGIGASAYALYKEHDAMVALTSGLQNSVNSLNTALDQVNTRVQDVANSFTSRIYDNEINIGYKFLRTLSVGETTVSVTDGLVSDTCLIDVYTNKFGCNPNAITQTNNTVTISFDAQTSDILVVIIVKEGVS